MAIKGADLLEYDWHTEKSRAVFGVDMSLYSAAPIASDGVLLYASCRSKKDDGELRGIRLSMCDSFFELCQRKLNIIFAGYIETRRQKRGIFYGSSIDLLDDMRELADRQPFLIIECGARRDEAWQTYFKLLYPDAAKYRTIENGRTIDALRKQGDMLNISRRISFHVFFPSEPIRIMFEQEARLAGFAIGEPEFADESDLPHGVSLHKISTLDKREIDDITTRIIRIASKYDGMLVHWDCGVVRR